MAEVIIYTMQVCPYCVRAKQLLDSKGVKYTEIDIDKDDAAWDEMVEKTNRRTVPQIFINGHHVGGCDDLYALHQKGKLDQLLKGE
jgi:glutaredoxin 3